MMSVDHAEAVLAPLAVTGTLETYLEFVKDVVNAPGDTDIPGMPALDAAGWQQLERLLAWCQTPHEPYALSVLLLAEVLWGDVWCDYVHGDGTPQELLVAHLGRVADVLAEVVEAKIVLGLHRRGETDPEGAFWDAAAPQGETDAPV